MTDLTGNVISLVSSAWSELGVPQARAHQRIVIDPEPLIAVTPHLARADNRLLGLAFDWCRIHSGQISASRIAGVARGLPEPASIALARFNGALAKHGVRWQPASKPLRLGPQRKRMALPMDRPALLAFRVRAIAGVSTRADILTRLLFAPQEGWGAADLCPSGTSRRSAELVLNELTQSGVARVHGSTRKRRFNLTDPNSFTKLTGAKGLDWWDWHRILDLMLHLLQIDEMKGSKRVRQVRAVAIHTEVAPKAARLGLRAPPRVEGRDDAVDGMRKWAEAIVARLASGKL